MDASYEAIAPGVTFAEVCAAATAADAAHQPDGERPWMPHFYLVHGVGIESAEMPFLGTDNGPDFDAANTLEPGMVLVLEPAIWDDGTGGYRAEEIVAVTDSGWNPSRRRPPLRPIRGAEMTHRSSIPLRGAEMSLHLQRRTRAVDALAAAGIDMLVAGRQDHINYITGAHQLWTAGTRPFGPVCTLNVATREIYLLSTWDEGRPRRHRHRPPPWHHLERGHHLPAPGRQSGHGRRPARVGVDAWSPGMAGLDQRRGPQRRRRPRRRHLAPGPPHQDALRDRRHPSGLRRWPASKR